MAELCENSFVALRQEGEQWGKARSKRPKMPRGLSVSPLPLLELINAARGKMAPKHWTHLPGLLSCSVSWPSNYCLVSLSMPLGCCFKSFIHLSWMTLLGWLVWIIQPAILEINASSQIEVEFIVELNLFCLVILCSFLQLYEGRLAEISLSASRVQLYLLGKECFQVCY